MSKYKKKTITIDDELVKWVQEKIEEKEFANFSHAMQKAMYALKKSYEEK